MQYSSVVPLSYFTSSSNGKGFLAMSHHKWIFLMSITVLLLTGCWDTINIEDRGLIVGSAIDLAEDNADEPVYSITDLFVLSLSFINPEELAKQKGTLINLIDHYLRDVKIRRGTNLIVSEGDAKEVLGFQQPEGNLPAINLMQLLDNSSDRSGFFEALVLGEVQEHFI